MHTGRVEQAMQVRIWHPLSLSLTAQSYSTLYPAA
jgi:hypothetical protein